MEQIRDISQYPLCLLSVPYTQNFYAVWLFLLIVELPPGAGYLTRKSLANGAFGPEQQAYRQHKDVGGVPEVNQRCLAGEGGSGEADRMKEGQDFGCIEPKSHQPVVDWIEYAGEEEQRRQE